ncbi:hypothetical protein RWE15_12150 [Virgibacillus halophilus]|uniref:Uncharacterized protein n=1 Tax=Tigheibacillus halophilus TaxID=361280 RepID=A0ABU5C8N8_9BACI|nr:hypothetical protein [Virgibacillus halophilus]
MEDICIHTRDWIEKTTPATDVPDVYKEFYTNETVQYALPKGDLPQWVDWVSPPQFGENHTFDASYVAKIENGSVWMCEKGEGMVYALTPDNRCLQDMVFHLYWKYFKNVAVKKNSFRSHSSWHFGCSSLGWALQLLALAARYIGTLSFTAAQRF